MSDYLSSNTNLQLFRDTKKKKNKKTWQICSDNKEIYIKLQQVSIYQSPINAF